MYAISALAISMTYVAKRTLTLQSVPLSTHRATIPPAIDNISDGSSLLSSAGDTLTVPRVAIGVSRVILNPADTSASSRSRDRHGDTDEDLTADRHAQGRKLHLDPTHQTHTLATTVSPLKKRLRTNVANVQAVEDDRGPRWYPAPGAGDAQAIPYPLPMPYYGPSIPYNRAMHYFGPLLHYFGPLMPYLRHDPSDEGSILYAPVPYPPPPLFIPLGYGAVPDRRVSNAHRSGMHLDESNMARQPDFISNTIDSGWVEVQGGPSRVPPNWGGEAYPSHCGQQ